MRKPTENNNVDEGSVDRLSELFKDLPQEKQKEARRIVNTLTVSHSFSGPLPPPNIVKGYDGVVKNGAERVFAMAESQSEHRIALEKYIVKKELKYNGRAQIFAFVLGVIGLLAATSLAIFGHDFIAGVFATTTIGGLATAFIIGTRAQSQNKDSE